MNYKHVIGLTGPIASGKGLAARAVTQLFEGQDVRNVLLSDYIRAVVRSNGDELTRDTLREAGNSLRREIGPGAWAQMMLEDLPEGEEGVLIVDSIRNPGEIDELRRKWGSRVTVIATDAPLEDRVARVIKRGREEDSAEAEEIARQMRIEMERNPEFGFDLEACKEKADFVSLGKETKAERIAEIQSELKKRISESDLEQRREVRRRIA